MKAMLLAAIAATLVPVSQEPDDFDAQAQTLGSKGTKVRFHSVETKDAKWKPDGTRLEKPRRSIFDLPDFSGITDGHRLWVELRLKHEDEQDCDYRFVESGKSVPQVYNSASWENKGTYEEVMVGSNFNFPAEQERVKFQFGVAEGERTVVARYFYKDGKTVKAEGAGFKPKITYGIEYGSNHMTLIVDVPPEQSMNYAVEARIFKTNGQPMVGFHSTDAHQTEFRFSYDTPHPPLGKVVVYTRPLVWITFEGTLRPT